LTRRKEAGEPEPLEAGPRDRLRIAREESEADARGLEPCQSLSGAGARFPATRVGGGKQLEVALGVARATRGKSVVDLGVAQPSGAEDVACDPLRGQAAVLDVVGRVRGDLDAVDLLQRLPQGPAAERIVGEKEGPVEVEERQQPAQMPSRSSIAASRRHLGRVFTWSSR
jgi:hypothetical protein